MSPISSYKTVVKKEYAWTEDNYEEDIKALSGALEDLSAEAEHYKETPNIIGLCVLKKIADSILEILQDVETDHRSLCSLTSVLKRSGDDEEVVG